jgi:hypothetical protein
MILSSCTYGVTLRLTQCTQLEPCAIAGAEGGEAGLSPVGDMRGKQADPWMAEHVQKREFLLDGGRDQGMSAGQLERCSAEIKEIVVQSNVIAAEHPSPDRDQRRGGLVDRQFAIGPASARPPAAGAPTSRPCLSPSAAGISE